MKTYKKLKQHGLMILLIGFLLIILISIKTQKQNIPRGREDEAFLEIQPPDTQIEINQEFELNLFLTTGKPFSGINIIFEYKKDKLQPLSLTINQEIFSDDLSPEFKLNSSKIILSGTIKKAKKNLPQGKTLLGKIKFKAISSGDATLNISADSQITGPGSPYSLFQLALKEHSIKILPSSTTITSTTTPANTPSNNNPTITSETQTPSPTTPVSTPTDTNPTNTPAIATSKLNFKLKLNGIYQKGPDLQVRLRLVQLNSGTKKDYQVKIISDDTGIYQNETPLELTDLNANTKYNILVKGPKHLQRRMETRINLSTKKLQFDWTDKPLEPGDLPNPAGNLQQDGIANSLDASLILERFDKTDKQSLQIADLNYDGIVNLNDYSLLISTLSIKREEDE